MRWTSWALIILMIAFLAATLVTDVEIQVTLGMTTYALSAYFIVATTILAAVCMVIAAAPIWWLFRGRRTDD